MSSPKSSKNISPKIALISGSIRADSINLQLVNAMAHVFKDLGAKPVKINLGAYEMPIYNGDWEDENGVPKATKNLVNRLKKCDGVFIATPEYNGCLPALLKNTIDWTTRIGLDHFATPVYAIGSATPGPMSGIMVLKQLHFILNRLSATVVPTQVGTGNAATAFDKKGRFVEGRTKDFAIKAATQVLAEIERRQS